jgi:type IV pilus assembly protein PilY1
MWEFTDANMGLTFGIPIIGKLADGTWVVVLSSGYNNADGVGRIYVLNAATGAQIFTISTGVGTPSNPSGLAKIVGYTKDGLHNNVIERIYGGDLLGNVWRFDVNDSILPAGKEAFLLASLKVGSTPQPITTTPELGDTIVNGVTYNYVFVGTGRYLGTTDLSDTTQESLYGLIDKFTTTGIGDARNAPTCPMVRQTLTALSTTSRTTSNNAVNPASTCGWFLDFNPANTTPGERVNVDMTLQLGIITIATNVPLNSVCTVGGTSWLYFFDYRSGTVLPAATGGVAGSQYDNSLIVGITTVMLGTSTGDPSQPNSPSGGAGGKLDTLVITSGGGGGGVPPPPPNLPGAGGKRAMWRELLN